MTFEVHINTKRKRKLLFGQVLCILMIVVLGWFLSLGVMCAYFQKEQGAYWLLVGFIVVFVCFLFLSFYLQRRPRILVACDTITIYPIFHKKRQITWENITSRKVKRGYTEQQIASSVVSTWGGILGYALYQTLSKKKMADLGQSCAWEYTYYEGKKKLIRIVSDEMENAERFDQLVREHLEGEVVETDWESIGHELENRKKKKPTAVFWLGCMIFLFAFFILTEFTRTKDWEEERTQTEPIFYVSHGVTFAIDSHWIAVDGYDGSFLDDATGTVYQLNGVAPLHSDTAQEYYETLLTFYEQNYSLVIAEPLEKSTTQNGVERYVANIKMVQDNTCYQYQTIVILPWQDTVITFGTQTIAEQAAKYEEEMIQTVENMALSAVYEGNIE